MRLRFTYHLGLNELAGRDGNSMPEEGYSGEWLDYVLFGKEYENPILEPPEKAPCMLSFDMKAVCTRGIRHSS
eukprot:gene18930-6286_t